MTSAWLTPTERAKMHSCAPLLPPPGGDELRRALDHAALADEIIDDLYRRLQDAAPFVKQLYVEHDVPEAACIVPNIERVRKRVDALRNEAK